MAAPYLSKLLNSWPGFKRVLASRSQAEPEQLPVAERGEPPVVLDLMAYYPRPFMQSVPPARRARLLEILTSIEQEAAHRRRAAKVAPKR